MIHELKTVNPYFTLVWMGDKRAELRNNDRNFAVGDILVLREFTPGNSTGVGEFTGRAVCVRISDVCDYPEALRPGFVMLSFYPLASCEDYEKNRSKSLSAMAMVETNPWEYPTPSVS